MAYKTDIEIAQECQMKHIREIAATAHVDEKYVEQYGNYKAKIDLSLLEESTRPDGKLILVTAITPTPAGEGKTTTVTSLPMRRRPSARPMVVVVFPSPAGVGVMAVTRISLPSGRSVSASNAGSTLAL